MSNYIDYIYIGGVIVAFIVFIFWNRGNNAEIRKRGRRRFGDELQSRRDEKRKQ